MTSAIPVRCSTNCAMKPHIGSEVNCEFIAQLVEHRTGITEVTGSNPVEALIFFRLLYSNCLNWKFTAKITYHLHIYLQFIHYVISLLSRENMNSQLTSLPMCGFIVQLVEHRTGIVEVTGSNPVEALIFFRFLNSKCLNWKFTAKITYRLHIYPQFIYESFHIHCTLHYFTPFTGKYELTIDLAPNVWLHSSVGRASHRYRGGHGFESH